MATRQTTCWIAVCDLCGSSNVDCADDVSTPHLDTPQEAIDYVTDDELASWTPSGRLVCTNTADDAHDRAHAQAGKPGRGSAPVIGADAMYVTWLDPIRTLPPATDWWPSPAEAYATAPSIEDETTWLTRHTSSVSLHSRDFSLRQAAVLDRIALRDDPRGESLPSKEALVAALRFLDFDQRPDTHGARAYVRQQYAREHR